VRTQTEVSRDESLSHGQRLHQPSVYLQDYICYTARSDPSHNAHSTPCGPSGTAYPIARYVKCDKFSLAHSKFLAAVTTGKEPEHFGAAM
jgi:hypothetical protein